MERIEGRNVNHLLIKGVVALMNAGARVPSRNGDVMRCPFPVTSIYGKPTERVLFHPQRDANPFFHLFESMWMLGGRKDLAFVQQFASTMRGFSDDGKTLWGAYGFRWRAHFNVDQIQWAVGRLKANPSDRRVVIQMWDPTSDPIVANDGGKDVPCNVSIKLWVDDGRLHMVVFNRSNDIVWGAYGANAVHMSILQEYIASFVGVEVGFYWQISCDYHLYLGQHQDLADHILAAPQVATDFYQGAAPVVPHPLVKNKTHWDRDLAMWLDNPHTIGFRDPFFRKILKPMLAAWTEWKQNDGEEKFSGPTEILQQMPKDNDWRLACLHWINRRRLKWLRS